MCPPAEKRKTTMENESPTTSDPTNNGATTPQCRTTDRDRPAPGVRPLPTIPPHGPNSIIVRDLAFSYPTAPQRTVLSNLSLTLPTGSRCLLIGSNGSGKSTLMKILAGRHLTHPDGNVSVLGLNAFRDTKLNFHRAYLDVEWGMRLVPFAGGNVPLMADIPVSQMMVKLQNSYPGRRDELVDILGIDLENWRMHQLSDGQRRRVQILLGLVRPFKILLLDEITTSLDVCVRQDLLRWLQRETETRGATIIYATHIFDGLEDWPTDLLYLTDRGDCGWQGKLEDLPKYQQLKADNHPAKILAIAESWLREELERKRRAKKREEAAGELAHALDPTDRQGGYASGRNLPMTCADATMDDAGMAPTRQGRLSDIMGKSGVLPKHN